MERGDSRLEPVDDAALSALRHKTRDIFADVLGEEPRDIAFLDFPTHRNFGDALIWKGTQRYLADLGFRVRYVADWRSFRAEQLQRLPGDSLIVLNGGGNLGDLYPHHEAFRRHVVTTHPRRRVVVMPQTIHFVDPRAMAASVADYRRAENLTLLLREEVSMDIAEKSFGGVDHRFCYDAALGAPLELTPARLPGAPVVLGRRDAEGLPEEGTELSSAVDWSVSPANQHAWRAVRRARGLSRRLPSARPSMTVLPDQWTYIAMNRLNITAATRQLERAPWVATNRLHAHILAVLLGVPHVVTDNTYGKISAIFNGYTSRFTTAHWADSLNEAVTIARELVDTDKE